MLYDVRELVRQELLPAIGFGKVLLRAKDEISTRRVCRRIEQIRGRGRALIGVHANVLKIVPEALFHVGTHPGAERLTRGTGGDTRKGRRLRRRLSSEGNGVRLECPVLSRAIVHGRITVSVG